MNYLIIMISSFTNGDRASLSAKQKWQKVKTLTSNKLGFFIFSIKSSKSLIFVQNL